MYMARSNTTKSLSIYGESKRLVPGEQLTVRQRKSIRVRERIQGRMAECRGFTVHGLTWLCTGNLQETKGDYYGPHQVNPGPNI